MASDVNQAFTVVIKNNLCINLMKHFPRQHYTVILPWGDISWCGGGCRLLYGWHWRWLLCDSGCKCWSSSSSTDHAIPPNMFIFHKIIGDASYGAATLGHVPSLNFQQFVFFSDLCGQELHKVWRWLCLSRHDDGIPWHQLRWLSCGYVDLVWCIILCCFCENYIKANLYPSSQQILEMCTRQDNFMQLLNNRCKLAVTLYFNICRRFFLYFNTNAREMLGNSNQALTVMI